jgi:hypothetical protein
MKRLMLLAPLVVLLPGLALAQSTPAQPTAAQCSADAGAWHEKNVDPERYDSLPSTELVRRQLEMLKCADAVGRSDIGKYSIYIDIAYDYEAARENRYYKFIERHRLLNQFYSEDAKASLKQRK